jgi:capsular polysaccharide biosynthesis protein
VVSSSKEIHLQSIFASLARKWWIIVCLALIIGGGGSYYFHSGSSNIMASVTASVLVGDSEEPSVNMSTMTALMNEPAVLETVVEELPWETSIAELNGKIATVEVEGSQIIRVTATEENPEKAVVLANTIVEVYPEVSYEITGIDTATVLSEANVKDAAVIDTPGGSNRMAAISIVVGLAAGIGAALLLDSVDHRIRNEKEVEQLLEAPVLGSLSRMDRYSMKSSKKNKVTKAERGEKIG